jgi:hypothetical protein
VTLNSPPTDWHEGGHEKAGETLFTTKCDEINTQSESYTLDKEELINGIKSMIEKDKPTMLESLESKLKSIGKSLVLNVSCSLPWACMVPVFI